MMKKYIITVLMAILLCIPSVVLANKQSTLNTLKIDDITYTQIVDPLSGNYTKKPTIKLSWVKGADSHERDDTDAITEPETVHSPERYEIYIKNISRNSESTLLDVVPATTNSYDVGKNILLEPGNLYQFQVLPVHYHRQVINETTSQVKAVYVQSDINKHPKVIGLTDYNIKLSAEGKQINVIWEDAGSWLNYDIYYGSGEIKDYTNMLGKIQDVREQSTSFIDPSDQRIKLRYTIKTSDIKSGQLYSVCVRPKVTSINGNAVYSNPRTNVEVVTTKVPFAVYQDSNGYVKLVWSGIDTSIGTSGNTSSYGVKKLDVIRRDDGLAIEQVIATLEGEDAINVGYYSDNAPAVPTNYRINITYSKVENGIEKFITMSSDWETYDPGAIRITPSKPEIPNINGMLKQDNNEIIDKSKYIGTFRIDKEKKSINLVWSAFERMDYTNTTEAKLIKDLDVYYDIWLTDDISVLYSSNNLCMDKDYFVADGGKNNSVSYIRNTTGEIIGFNKEYTKYLAAVKENGVTKGYELRTIDPNKVYYIKIIAKKIILNETLRSEPVIVSVYFDSDEVIYVPPVLPKPPLRINNQGTEDITIEWKKSWWEVVSNDDPDRIWFYKVWLVDGDIVFTQVPGVTEITLNTKDDVDKLVAKLNPENKEKYSYRQINLGKNISYDVKVIPYKDVETIILEKQKINPNYNVGDYIESIKNTTGTLRGWETITTQEDPGDLTKQTVLYTKTGLTPNTSYMILIKPFRIISVGNEEEKLYALNPTVIISTTIINEEVITPDPSVPDLYLSRAKDTEIDVKWKYNTSMQYQIKYNTTENITTAKEYPIVLPASVNDPNYPKNGQEFILTIKDLMPKTEYYFWIKAIQINGKKESAWSNATLFNTTEILPNPMLPPQGIGVADVAEPIGQDYLTLEWTRLEEDISADEENKKNTVKKLYSYIITIADNVRFLDAREMEITDFKVGKTENGFQMISKSVVKITGLKPSTKYYFKIKSKVIASRGNEPITSFRESVYSEVRVIKTSSSDEYDSNIDDLNIKLPDKVKKEYANEVLTYTIEADARVISDILKDENFRLTLDLKEYTTISSSGKKVTSNKKINTRIAKIPYTVVDTLVGRKMSLDILTDDMTISIPYTAYQTPAYMRAKQLGGLKNYVITVTNDASSLNAGGARITKAKEIKVQIETKHGSLSENYYNDKILISYDVGGVNTSSNMKLYVYDKNKRTWVLVPEQIITSKGRIIGESKTLGKYGISY